mgnify:CR=1 FL=1
MFVSERHKQSYVSETALVDFSLPHRSRSTSEWRKDMNFDNIMKNRIETLRVVFYSALQAGCPYVDDFDNEFITIDDVINFTIYEGIKKSYDYYAPKMKISEYVKKSSSLEDRIETDTKFYSRQLQYAQYYRSELNDMIEDDRGIRIPELEGRDISDIKVRTEGIELNEMSFYEFLNLSQVGILKKITAGQISDSKKVSNSQFRLLVKEYESELDCLYKEMKSDALILLNTHKFFNLEWIYNIDLIYDIAMEAEKRGAKKIDIKQLWGIAGGIYIQGDAFVPDGFHTQSRMLMSRKKLIPLIFEDDKVIRNKLVKAYRMNYFLYYFNKSKLHEFLHDMVSEKEMAEFVKKYFWIWDTRSKKEWTDKRIKIARQLFSEIIMHVEKPQIR